MNSAGFLSPKLKNVWWLVGNPCMFKRLSFLFLAPWIIFGVYLFYTCIGELCNMYIMTIIKEITKPFLMECLKNSILTSTKKRGIAGYNSNEKVLTSQRWMITITNKQFWRECARVGANNVLHYSASYSISSKHEQDPLLLKQNPGDHLLLWTIL